MHKTVNCIKTIHLCQGALKTPRFQGSFIFSDKVYFRLFSNLTPANRHMHVNRKILEEKSTKEMHRN